MSSLRRKSLHYGRPKESEKQRGERERERFTGATKTTNEDDAMIGRRTRNIKESKKERGKAKAIALW